MINIDSIKRWTLQAMMSDELLMYGLVLKGGNALHLAYNISNRGSVDIDFSMKDEFSPKDFFRLQKCFDSMFNQVFNKHGYTVFDVNFREKPKKGDIPEWKGYLLEFKIYETNAFGDTGLETQRRNAVKVRENQSTRYTVDISAYEYIDPSDKKEIDGLILRVYSPEMILFEKVRALCQTMDEYMKIVSSAKQKQRARDLYDIYIINTSFDSLDLNKQLLIDIFKAKQVPLGFINNMESLRERNRDAWQSVIDTVDQKETLKEYDYYFDYLIDLLQPFREV